MTIADTDIFLADVETAEGMLRFSGGGPDSGGTDGYTTGGGDTPASTKYPPRIQQVAMLSRTMFGDRTTSGESTTSVGDVVLRNEDYALDAYKRYAFDGRRIVIYRGQAGAAYPAAFTPVLDATMTTPTWDGPVALKVRDNQKYLDRALQTTTYAGTNAPNGLEGTPDDLKGKLKPVCVCGATNISPPRVDAIKGIFQVHDGAISDVTAVRDRGAPLGRGFTWGARTSPYGGGNHAWYDAAGDGATTWVMVGTNTTTTKLIGAYSTDNGATWNNITFPAGMTTPITAVPFVFFGNGKWVIGGIGDGTIGWSSNATTWTISTTIPNTAGTRNVIGKAGVYATHLSKYVIVGALNAGAGNNGQTLTSSDAITWAQVDSGINATLQKISYNGSLLVLIYQQSLSGVSGGIASTPDAATWIVRSSAFDNFDFNALTHDEYNGQFLAHTLKLGGTSGSCGITPDGITWERVPPFIGTGASDVIHWLAHGDVVTLSLNSSGWMSSTIDGRSWTPRQQVSTGKTFLRVVFGNASFLLLGQTSGNAGFIYQSEPTAYANTTDLLDDTKAPQAGRYIVCPSAGYFRVGSSPNASPTCDVLQGATAADRTAGKAFVIANQRAGNTTGDWSASDITALDAADDSEVEFWAGPDDTGVMCSDVADAAARTVGAGWWADTSGVLRIRQLTAPDSNLVTNPDVVTADAGWTIGGSGVGTAAFSVIGGVPLTRLSSMSGAGASRAVTVTGSVVKRFAIELQWDGVAGTSVHGIFDNTAAAFIASASIVWTAGGVATATASAGSIVQFFQIGPNAYALVLNSTAANAAHTHSAHALAGGAIASIRVGRVTVYDAVPTIALDENDLVSNLTPLPSNDPNGGISPWKTTLRYAKNYTVQTTDLADIVSDADRVFYGLDWREAKQEDAAVLTRHPLSQPMPVETLYRVEADAQAEATRRQALLGADREWYECGVKMTTATVALDLGDVIELAHERFGVGPAARLRILGIRPEIQENAAESRLMLVLWR